MWRAVQCKSFLEMCMKIGLKMIELEIDLQKMWNCKAVLFVRRIKTTTLEHPFKSSALKAVLLKGKLWNEHESSCSNFKVNMRTREAIQSSARCRESPVECDRMGFLLPSASQMWCASERSVWRCCWGPLHPCWWIWFKTLPNRTSLNQT